MVQGVSAMTHLDFKKPGKYPVLFSNKNANTPFKMHYFLKKQSWKISESRKIKIINCIIGEETSVWLEHYCSQDEFTNAVF